jgi:hypothetical protein
MIASVPSAQPEERQRRVSEHGVERSHHDPIVDPDAGVDA